MADEEYLPITENVRRMLDGIDQGADWQSAARRIKQAVEHVAEMIDDANIRLDDLDARTAKR